ncbi:MAG TPA: diguanylate cyclase [Gemmatimonadales bacterium]|nr:diguanylate cyclase [Gemmatimonadales bacterium]
MSYSGKILIADDDPAVSFTLAFILREHGYEVTTVPGGDHLLEQLQSDAYDLLLLDIMMPRVDGLQVLERVKADARFRDLPVLMISSMPPEDATVRSLGLGASDFIPKPFKQRELLARVKAHLRMGRELNSARSAARDRAAVVEIMHEVTAALRPDEIYQILVRRVAHALNISRCSILLAGPDERTATVVAAYENPMLHNLPVDLRRYPEIRHSLATGDTVLVRDVGTDPLYREVRDAWMAEGRPVPTRSAICVRFSLKEKPAGVFFLRTTGEHTALNEHDLEFVTHIIRAAVAALERAYDLETAVLGQEEMRQLAETDPLTGVYNRRALIEKLEQEMDRAARYAARLTCMMIDIDNFKQINDVYGHLVGDRVLKQLATLLRRELRSVDVVARYGGEEFVVLLPETTVAESRNFAERLLGRVATHEFGEPDRPVRVTISIGMASYPDERVSDGQSLLRLADTHLYRAKTDGRNRFRD